MSRVVRGDEFFYIVLPDSSRAWLKYRLEKGRVIVVSTFTPPEHRGKGLAARLMDEVVSFASSEGLKIVPLCSYAKSYMEKHPELKHLFEKPLENGVKEFFLTWDDEPSVTFKLGS
ncbi:MAG: GNAT family N-acetyltransferase [Thermoproteota archaeon]